MKLKPSFQKESFQSKILIVSVILFLVLVAFAFIFAVYYFGLLGFFKLLDVQFDSLYTLFLFVLFYLLLGVIGDSLIKLVTICIYLLVPSKLIRFFMRFLLVYFINWIIIHFLDNAMDSIQLGGYIQMLAAVLISVIELAFDEGPKKEQNRKCPEQH
ncbi:MAG: YrvL family regulatory protein [Bacillus sp. (in: firmicutes)]